MSAGLGNTQQGQGRAGERQAGEAWDELMASVYLEKEGDTLLWTLCAVVFLIWYLVA